MNANYVRVGDPQDPVPTITTVTPGPVLWVSSIVLNHGKDENIITTTACIYNKEDV